MDPLELHRRAGEVAVAAISDVGEPDLGLPTPCEGWRVADLVDHLIEACRWSVERLTGELPPEPERATPAEAFAAVAAEAQRAFEAPGRLDGTVALPFGEIPVAVFLAIRSGDQYQHAWDLRAALGADTDLDREVGEAVAAATRPILTPELRGEGRPFGPEQPCPPGAPPADRFAAFLGRRVAGT